MSHLPTKPPPMMNLGTDIGIVAKKCQVRSPFKVCGKFIGISQGRQVATPYIYLTRNENQGSSQKM
jgi:hypothetical protein